MIVELFGPPGAGKTALAEALAARLGGRVVALSTLAERYGYLFLFLLLNPVRAIGLVSKTVRLHAGSPSLLRHKLFLLSNVLARVSKARMGEERVAVLDEGLAHYLLVKSERLLSPGEAEDYFRRYVASDVVIAVLADEEVRAERMKRRGRIPRGHHSVDQKEWQALMGQNARLVSRAISGRKGAFMVESDEPPTELARRLAVRISMQIPRVQAT